MSKTIDERVVSLKFDGSQFVKGISGARIALNKFKSLLDFKGGARSLNELNAAGKRFSLAGIEQGVQQLSSKFSALSVIGVTALATIANKAINAGLRIASALTIDPMKSGLAEYETQINSIQTILANTKSKGTTVDDVNGALDELNEYADKTIYNFSEMTNSIGKFTTAGIDLDTSVQSIKGFSNVAAMSGANAQQAAVATQQLSQAMSSGTIRLQDWMSIENAGMASEGFRNSLIETAKVNGVAVDDMIEKNGSFRNSLQEEWLTADIMIETLSKFTGDLTDQQLKQMGYTDEQIKGIQEMAASAAGAATDVKSATQLMETLAEAAGSGWAQTWRLIIGDFEEAKALWTNVSDVLGGIIGKQADARNELVSSWKDLGGRDELIKGLGAAWEALISLAKPIGDAFRDIFPPMTAKTLYDMTVNFRKFAESLKIGDSTAGKLSRTFRGVFAVFGIVWEVVKGLLGALGNMFGVAQDGAGSFLDLTAAAGDAIFKFYEFIKTSGALQKVFSKIGAGAKVVGDVFIFLVGVVVDFVKAVADGFRGGFDASLFTDFVDRIVERAEMLGPVADFVKMVFGKVVNAAKSAWTALQPFFDGIGDMFGTLGDMIMDALSDISFDGFADLLNAGSIAALVALFWKFAGDLKAPFKSLTDIFDNLGGLGGEGGLISSITGTFGELTGTLEAMQSQLKAQTLIKIAGAIALLTASVVVLSLIDSDALTRALTAMTVMFTQLFTSMAIFEKATASAGFAKMPLVAGAMILLAGAMVIMSFAVKSFSDLDWDELARGLTGVAGALGLMVGWSAAMSKQQGPMIRSAAAMILVGAALKILASAVKDFAELSWGDMARGLTGAAAVMGALALFGKFGGGISVKSALAMVVIGAALKVLASALEDFSSMSPENLVKSIAGVAGAMLVLAAGTNAMNGSLMGAASLLVVVASLWVLVPLLKDLGEMSWNEIAKAATMLAASLAIIAGGMYLMTGIIAGAASMLVAVAALWVLVPLLEKMGGMSWEEIGKACAILGASLAIIAAGMYLMTGALPGAAALIVVSAALAILTPVLIALSLVPWQGILTGLGALAGVFLVLGVAGLVLTPVVPTLMLLGAAIALIGAGAGLAGAGLLMAATGLATLGAAAATGGQAIVTLLKDLIGLIPYAISQVGQGIVQLAQVIIAGAPAIAGAFQAIVVNLLRTAQAIIPQLVATFVLMVQSILGAVRTLAPEIMATFTVLMQGILRTIRTLAPEIYATFETLVRGLLRTIRNLAPDIAATFETLMRTLLRTIRNLAPDIIATMVYILNSLLNAIQRDVPKFATKATNIVVAFINAIKSNLGRVISAGTDLIVSVLNGINRSIQRIVQAGVKIIISFLRGISQNLPRIIREGANVVISFMNGISQQIPRLVQSAINLIVRFVNGLASGIRQNQGRLRAAARNLAGAIIDGMTGGLASGANKVVSKAKNVAQSALNAAKGALGINSPSKEFIKVGQWTSEGFAIGIDNYAKKVGVSSDNMGRTALSSVKDTVSKVKSTLDDVGAVNPTIKPVLDLTNVRKDAGQINRLLDAKKSLQMDASMNRANLANSEYSYPEPSSASAAASSQVNYNIEQNIQSPKAVSHIEVYRNTKNLLSTLEKK